MPSPEASERPAAALTGGTGFIGKAVARDLASHGWRVRALFRPQSRTRCGDLGEHVEWIEGDLHRPESLIRLMEGVQAAVHCAGAIRGLAPSDYESVNIEGVGQIVHAALRQGVRHVVLISSLAAREPTLSPYAASKRFGEERLAQEAGEMRWTILRPPAVYGPGDREILPLLRWMRRGVVPVLGKGRFSLLYVDDLAEAIRRILLAGEAANRWCIELDDGRPEGYSWEELTGLLAATDGRRRVRLPVPGPLLRGLGGANAFCARALGYAPLLTPGKVRELQHPNWVCDNSLVSALTGWRPEVDFSRGMELLFGRTERRKGGQGPWRTHSTRRSSRK